MPADTAKGELCVKASDGTPDHGSPSPHPHRLQHLPGGTRAVPEHTEGPVLSVASFEREMT